MIAIGACIGHYRVLRLIGEGGFGSVYEAEHVQIGRRAAIKVLHPEYAQNAQIATRFINEARAVNIVNHTGVVGAFEFGQLEDGAPFIVLEYLQGETLSARIKRTHGGMSPEMLYLARQVASALAAAHAKGIIHRDLKPDNVMIVPDSEMPLGERAKVLDFGIAKLADGLGPEGVRPGTRTGMAMGTPAYMAPEQCRGAGAVDEKADVYSLGIVLFEMLTGKAPFEGEGIGELMAMQQFAEPPKIRDLNPAVPKDLAALVHTMLAKSAAERPSMGEVARALDGIATVNSRGPSTPRTPPRINIPGQRGPASLGRRVAIGAGAALVTAAIAGAVLFITVGRDRTSGGTGSVVAEHKPGPRERAIAHHQAGKRLQDENRWKEAEAEYQKALAEDPDYVPSRFNLGLVMLNERDAPAARDFFSEVLRRQPDHPQVYVVRGQAALDMSDFVSAIADLEAAVKRQPKDTSAWLLLGQARARAGQGDAARKAFCRAKELGSPAAAQFCS